MNSVLLNKQTQHALISSDQLCNEKIVPASVGLKFHSLDGTAHTLHRRMAVTLNKSGTRTFKTTENSLKTEGQETTAGSKRLSDTDEQVCMLLGVSPAILDSVIFCHQDDSLWPMSEPSTLKKKFDEIFEAQKYTKAIDQLKVVRKKQGEQLRSLQMQLRQEENNKNAAKENSARIRELQTGIEQLGEEEKALQDKIDDANRTIKSKREEASQFLGIMNDLENLRNVYKFRNDAVAELRDSIDMMPETDEELKRASEEYETRLERLQGLIDEDSEQYHDLDHEVGEYSAKVNAKLGERGKLESDKEKHERQLQTRAEMIQQAAEKHGIRGFGNDIDDEQVRVFYDKMRGLLTAKKKEHEKLEKELAKTVDEANLKISELEGSKSSFTSQRTFSRQKRTENDRKIKRLQTDVDALDYDEGRIIILEANRTALDERYEKAQEAFSGNSWDDQIQGARKFLGELEKAADDLNSELILCTRLSSERAQLDLRKKELTERERNLESLMGTYRGIIASLLEREWSIDSLGSDYKTVRDKRSDVVTKSKEKCDALQKELDQYEFELAEARKRHATMTEMSKEYETSVMHVLSEVSEESEDVTIQDYETVLDKLEVDLLQDEKDLNLFDEFKSHWTKIQTTLNNKNKCRTCDRTFDDDRSKARILKNIATYLDDKTKGKLEQDVREKDNKLVSLRARHSDYDGFRRLVKDELPKIKKVIDGTHDRRDEKLRELEAAASKHEKDAEALREVESVSKTVSDIIQLHTGIRESKEQIGKLQSQSQLSGTGRSTDEIHAAQIANSERTREAKKNLDNLNQERQRSLDQITTLELERSESKNKIAQARQQMDKKLALTGDIKALKDDNSKQDDLVSKIDEDLKALQPRIDAARGQRDAELARGREKAKLVADERDNVSHTFNKLKIIEDDIQDYVEQDKASALMAVERSIRSLQQQHTRLKEEMQEVMTRINSQKAELSQGDRRRKNINDNLRYREHCRTLDSVSAKIEELKDHNAEEDYNNLMSEVNAYANEVSIYTGEKHKIAGRVGAMELELKDKLESLQTFYLGAEEKYKETKMKVETKKLAIDDLFTYSNAVDSAIMQFHSLKMEEVNRIAGELWRATYQGTDIDTIAIRSEKDIQANSNNNRRSYNYRLTMVKQDTEMDMRGRCSAGQKVLASIIIRLALAESFGVNCGLIALDEPTTNLDSDNIRSLAVSLHGIIKARQAQDNFQLIVITHDEEFLRHMRCNEFCDKFYRVKRNENQCSVIIKDDVSRITE